MFTGRSLQTYVAGPSGVTLPIGRCKCNKNCMTYSHRHPSTTDPQMFPNVPAMHITKCTPNIPEKLSWFSSSIQPRMEKKLDSSNPRNVILLCTAGLIKSIVKTRFGRLEGKFLDKSTEMVYCIKSLYIYIKIIIYFLCIWYYFIAMTYFKLYIISVISVISLYPICMV